MRYQDLSLHSAVRRRPVQLTKTLHEKGVKVNTVNAYGETPLLCVVCSSQENDGCNVLQQLAREEQLELVKLLIEKGASFKKRTRHFLNLYNDCPIHLANQAGGNNLLIKTFLKKGANVNVANGLGLTPLHLAARSSEADELVPLLLRYGADVSAKDDNGWNVLHHITEAVNRNAKRAAYLAKELIEKGASLEDRTYHYCDRPIHLAIEAGGNNLQLVEIFLEKGANVNVADASGRTPLHLALESSKAEKLVPLLLQYGADVFAKENRGRNVLHQLALARREHVELAKLFIAKGVSLSDPDYENQCQPIHLAIFHKKIKLIKLFLDHGVDVNAPAYKNELFPLWFAADLEDTETLKTLLRYGANVHLKTRTGGCSALYRACQLRKEDIIRLLLSAGADVFAEDFEGVTPFDIMMYNNLRSDSTIWLTVFKDLALKETCLVPSVRSKVERVTKTRPEIQDKFENYIAQINMMKSTRFIGSCTLFELLTKSHRQIASLMRNPEFEAGFRQFDLQPFSAYAEDICRAFERAKRHFRSTLEQENLINKAVYYALPDLVVRKVVRHIFIGTDCCQNVIVE